jgi:hypothetical protein
LPLTFFVSSARISSRVYSYSPKLTSTEHSLFFTSYIQLLFETRSVNFARQFLIFPGRASA